MQDDFECFAGIDWATEAHQVCLVDRAGVILGERSFAHSGAGLADLCDWLVATGGAQPAAIAAAIEVPHGAVVDTLLERGFAAFSINPKQLDRFRDRFTVAGAKDDRRDALVLGDSLRTDRHCFRRLETGAPALVELREWSRMAEELGQERVRLANRLREQLRRYYPQALEVSDDVAADWFLDLWARVPTPEKTRRARESGIAKLLGARRIRKIDAAIVASCARSPSPSLQEPSRPPAPTSAPSANAWAWSTARSGRPTSGSTPCAGPSPARQTRPRGRRPGGATWKSCAPCPGSEGSSSPPCSQKRPGPCAIETTTPSEVCPASRP